jgi:hypothetical protein
MCSARCFSYSVVEAGDSAFMAKMDMTNAYKNIPCTPNEYRLQGFHWLGKFFVETRQIFGAKTAVCNFDVLGNTILELTLTECDIDRSLVHRQLDDVPIVVPNNKKLWCDDFVMKYKQNCSDVGIGLANDDPCMDKAFSCTQCGKVLGVIFNTVGLKWTYPIEKRDKLLRAIKKFINGSEVSLLEMQQLMGRINDVGIMIPFLKCYKGPLNEMLGWLQVNPDKKCLPSNQCIKDVLVWAGFLLDNLTRNPIAHRPMGPPLSHYSFTSDAAGFSDIMPVSTMVGVGIIGFDVDGEICMVNQTFWPKELRFRRDEKESKFGSKTVFLELVGLLGPFLLCPKLIANSHVVLSVDNIGCYYGWENKGVQGDKCASILIRTLVLVSSFLSVYVHVRHLPRMSSWDSSLCDRLSRKDTTSSNDERLLNHYKSYTMPIILMDWLRDPVEDWNLCERLLNYVKSITIR